MMKIEHKLERTPLHFETEEIEVFYKDEQYVIQTVQPEYKYMDKASEKSRVMRLFLNEDEIIILRTKLNAVQSPSQELNFD